MNIIFNDLNRSHIDTDLRALDVSPAATALASACSYMALLSDRTPRMLAPAAMGACLGAIGSGLR